MKNAHRMNHPGRAAGSQRGAAAVELAVVLPVLVTILVGAADFGRVFYWSVGLTQAARAGAAYAAQSSTTAANAVTMKAKAVAAAGSDLTTLGTTDICVASGTCTAICSCASDDGTSIPDPTAELCVATCASGTHQIKYVKVSATKSFSMATSYIPSIANGLSITRSAYQRVQ